MLLRSEARLLQKCLCLSAQGNAALHGPFVTYAPLHRQLYSQCVAAAQGPQLLDVVLQRCRQHGQNFLAQPLLQAEGPDVCCNADRISIDGPVCMFTLSAGGRQASRPQKLPAWGATGQNLGCKCKLLSSVPTCVQR